jgi:hypothetical protein
MNSTDSTFVYSIDVLEESGGFLGFPAIEKRFPRGNRKLPGQGKSADFKRETKKVFERLVRSGCVGES